MTHIPVPTDRPWVIFTDLDGTLIDHHTYGAQGSRDALRKLAERAVPLVFCSSKTFAEQVYLQAQLGIFQPFIFENGSAAALPLGFFPKEMYPATQRTGGYDIVVFAHANAAALRVALANIRDIRGYADVSDAELSDATGLHGEALHRARERWFTETLLSSLDEAGAAAVQAVLRPAGFTLSRGGRFYTAQSALVDKGKATRWMMELFRQTSPSPPCFAAMGDSPNDAPMLEAVDLPFLVQRPDGSWATEEAPHKKITGVGPAGFSAAVNMLLGE